jgi:small conductance mechanosensitive channel
MKSATAVNTATNDFWAALSAFFATPLGTILFRVGSAVLVVIGAIVASWLLRIAIRHTVQRIVTTVKKAQGVETTQALQISPVTTVRVVQRTRTLGSVLTNIANVVVGIIALLLVLHFLAPNVLSSFAILSAAIGAGLGFGAQNVIGDILGGLLIVMEDQLGVGDIVEAGMVSLATDGVVEAVGIRTTQIRDVNGTLWYVRNGQILRVGNMSQGWSRVIVDVAVGYDNDVEAVQEQLLKTAETLAREPKWRPRIIERPEIWGIQSISTDMVVLRVAVKTRSTARDDVANELNSRIFAAARAMDVTVPELRNPILTGFESIASVNGAHPPRTRPIPAVEAEAKPKRRAPRRKPSSGPPEVNPPEDQL